MMMAGASHSNFTSASAAVECALRLAALPRGATVAEMDGLACAARAPHERAVSLRATCTCCRSCSCCLRARRQVAHFLLATRGGEDRRLRCCWPGLRCVPRASAYACKLRWTAGSRVQTTPRLRGLHTEQ